MARRNPKIIELEEKLRKANLRADNAEELHHRAEGKLEKYEEQEEREKEEVRMMRRREDEYRQKLEDEVMWMRRLVEYLTVPKEKIDLIEKARHEITISGDPGYPRNRY